MPQRQVDQLFGDSKVFPLFMRLVIVVKDAVLEGIIRLLKRQQETVLVSHRFTKLAGRHIHVHSRFLKGKQVNTTPSAHLRQRNGQRRKFFTDQQLKYYRIDAVSVGFGQIGGPSLFGLVFYVCVIFD